MKTSLTKISKFTEKNIDMDISIVYRYVIWEVNCSEEISLGKKRSSGVQAELDHFYPEWSPHRSILSKAL